MYEVTIPLRASVGNNEIGVPEDYFRIIQDEYASRYLVQHLGIASTPANKATVMRCRPLEDCEVQGIWPESKSSAVADAIKIVPPLRQRLGDVTEISGVDRNMLSQFYGHVEPIDVKPPPVPGPTISNHLDEDFDEPKMGGTGGLGSGGGTCAGIGAGTTTLLVSSLGDKTSKTELANELERMRLAGPSSGPAGMELCTRRGAAKRDTERFERMRQELAVLKAKFIMPFACERPSKELGKTDVVLWPMEGTLAIDIPKQFLEETLEPIRISLEDVRKNTTKWVDESMPLELLTSRKSPDVFADIRSSLCDPDVSRLIGVLAHLLHWLIFSHLKHDGLQLSESALQTMFVAVHELWCSFEKYYRDTAMGVSFMLPCLMLTLKRGIERCYELTYPTMMADEELQQQVIDRINALLMRLFDPDGVYARFGKFDGTGKAISITKRLDMMLSAQGSTHLRRLHGRAHRSTPLVRSVLGNIGAGSGRGQVCNSQTRSMLQRSDLGGTVAGDSVVSPPRDGDRQRALLKAAMYRLDIIAEGPLKKDANAGGDPSSATGSGRRVQALRPTSLSVSTPRARQAKAMLPAVASARRAHDQAPGSPFVV